jgi:hypothetical protein
MYATIRWYGGNTELAGQLASRGDEVKSVIDTIPGFQAYYLVRVDGGTVSISVFDDEAGAEESNRAAAAWLGANMPEVSVDPPATSAGEVVLSA